MSYFQHSIRPFSILALLLIVSGSGTTEDNGIFLHFINGKNGKPIGNEHVLVFFGATAEDVRGKKTHRDLRTDVNGMTVLSLEDSSMLYIQVFPDSYVLCQKEPNNKSYSVVQIERTGLSTVNNCGSFLRENMPRQFVVYARPASFWDGMRW